MQDASVKQLQKNKKTSYIYNNMFIHSAICIPFIVVYTDKLKYITTTSLIQITLDCMLLLVYNIVLIQQGLQGQFNIH